MKRKLHVLILLGVAALLPLTAHAQVRAVYDQGAGALGRQLQRLQSTASVLHTGAHPDDEDSALIAYHARRGHARTGYLSLTRGSGGQNIIGTEQADLLGVIRTEELLQARRLDGAEQFFTRAIDFGFSKYRSEASRLWDEELLLADMVRAIRTFRPSVIVSRFTGTAADGHGHHQFAGYLTPLAYAAAADPNRFPEQVDAGLLPWKAQKFYVRERGQNGGFDSEVLVVNTGEVDPIAGRSYFEIGMQGRSQQKTQQMGQLELRGRQPSAMRRLDFESASGGEEKSIFDGIDTSISGIALFEPDATDVFQRLLDDLERTAQSALAAYAPFTPQSLIPVLARGLALSREARRHAAGAESQRLLDEKSAEFERALMLAAGVSVDALAGSETVTPGGALQVVVRIFDAGGTGVGVRGVDLAMPVGWSALRAAGNELQNERAMRRKEQADSGFLFDIAVPASAELTQPYWLEQPSNQFVYDWSTAGKASNRPFRSPLITAVVDLDIGGERVTVRKEVEYRLVDRVRGEIRRRLDVVPAVSVEPASKLLVVSTTSAGRRIATSLTIRNHTASPVSGAARIDIPAGWAAKPLSATFSIGASPASTTIAFDLDLPDGIEPGRYSLPAVVSIAGQDYNQTLRKVAYPHIRTHRIYEPAQTNIEVVDVQVAPVKIGYVMGSGDKVPDALRQLGLEVTLLDDDMLTSGDLSRFDTIVIGIRASQTREAFVANNSRLLAFAREGGALIVQYQQADFMEKNLVPYPAKMDHVERVVDETAPVTILHPEHPVFSFPNRITTADFDHWVQERYNHGFTSFDKSHYLPLTESHDSGEPEGIGGMVYARIGKGHYVYTGYSWFRQLPNGVPGAYRLFANLLSLPASTQ
jgi:LmbE family N-acetylglucosaminyl deacetylase